MGIFSKFVSRDKFIRCSMHGLLLSHIEEWNLDICDNMVGARGYYAKDNKDNKSNRVTNTVWCHLNMETEYQNQ